MRKGDKNFLDFSILPSNYPHFWSKNRGNLACFNAQKTIATEDTENSENSIIFNRGFRGFHRLTGILFSREKAQKKLATEQTESTEIF